MFSRSSCALLAIGLMCVLSDSGMAKDRSGETNKVSYSTQSATGWLFVEGKPIRPPYQVDVTSKGILVNGVTLPQSSFDNSEARRDRDDSYPQYNEAPRRRRNQMGSSRQSLEARSRVLTARRIGAALESESYVVIFKNQPVRSLSRIAEKFAFCDAIVSDSPTSQQRREFGLLAHTTGGQAVWEDWLSGFQPEPSLRLAMQEYVDAVKADELLISGQFAAESRLERYAYPLTVFGMLLGITSFAHLMRWTRLGFAEADSKPGQALDVRSSGQAMLLIVGMSVLDLVWTVLAFQAGIMAEINPIAERFVESPAQLAAFKLAMTGLGLGILFTWRRSRIMQQATWMMCFVCVLLTFRWVVFDSVIQ